MIFYFVTVVDGLRNGFGRGGFGAMGFVMGFIASPFGAGAKSAPHGPQEALPCHLHGHRQPTGPRVIQSATARRTREQLML